MNICKSVPLYISFNKSHGFRLFQSGVKVVQMLKYMSTCLSVQSRTFVVLLRFLLTFLSLFVIGRFVWTETSVRCASCDWKVSSCIALFLSHRNRVRETAAAAGKSSLCCLTFDSTFSNIVISLDFTKTALIQFTPLSYSRLCSHHITVFSNSNWSVIKMQQIIFDFHTDSASLPASSSTNELVMDRSVCWCVCMHLILLFLFFLSVCSSSRQQWVF